MDCHKATSDSSCIAIPCFLVTIIVFLNITSQKRFMIYFSALSIVPFHFAAGEMSNTSEASVINFNRFYLRKNIDFESNTTRTETLGEGLNLMPILHEAFTLSFKIII